MPFIKIIRNIFKQITVFKNIIFVTGPLLNHTIKRGGLQIRKELEAAINRNPGANVILTSGGSLPCRYIIHLNLMRDIHAGKKVIIEAFKELTKLNCKTVCIPAFGKLLKCDLAVL